MLIAAKLFLGQWWKHILAALVIAPAIFLLGQCDGRKSERHAWEAKVARQQAEAEARARKADEDRRKAIGASTGAIKQDRKELDDATRNLPDETPSARRRARICRELQQAARARKATPPAC